MFVFALEREAKYLRKCNSTAQIQIVGIAGKPIFTERPSAVIVCGYAGALRPELKVGAIVIPVLVQELGGSRSAPRQLTPTLVLPDQLGTLLTVNGMVVNAEDKATLEQISGAQAIDMETLFIAQQCNEGGIPWAAVRVISDEVGRALPAEVQAIFADNRVSLSRVLWAMLRRPKLVMEFYRLARDTRLASKRLAEKLVELMPTIGVASSIANNTKVIQGLN